MHDCWIPPWRGGGSCFVCAGSEIHHCYLFSAGSICESCVLIPALHPLCIPSELILKSPLLQWGLPFALASLPVLLLLLPPQRPLLPFNAAKIHTSREKSAYVSTGWCREPWYSCVFDKSLHDSPLMYMHICLFSTHLWEVSRHLRL